MKKITLLFLLSWLSLGIFAIDVITLTSSQQVSCTIVETSETTIKYITDDGFFELPISDVRSVKYSNGREQVFNAAPASTTPATNLPSSSGYVPYRAGAASAAPTTTQSATTTSEYQPYPGTTQAAPAQSTVNTTSVVNTTSAVQPLSSNTYKTITTRAREWPKHPIEKTGSTYYMDDKPIPWDVYPEFLRINCPKAYQSYKSGLAMGWTGFAFMLPGAALLGAGAGLYAENADYQTRKYDPYSYSSSSSIPTEKEYRKQIENRYNIGQILLGLGVPVLVGSVVMMSVGFKKYYNAHKVYNNSLQTNNPASVARNQPPLRLNVITHGNDIGLALAF